jgi:hypothetical protein
MKPKLTGQARLTAINKQRMQKKLKRSKRSLQGRPNKQQPGKESQ